MRLHFESNLDYQLQAIEAVCDLFRGQEICRTEFTVTQGAIDGQLALEYQGDALGIGNRLTLLDDEILKNLQAVQLRNGLPIDSTLRSGDFTVEMETGTGKTYVYLRTIFELNKRYGFTKFVIVVPSVAIKEGVYKTLQITEDHFKSLYAGVPFEYFIYDSAKLGQVRNFATSPNVKIMIVTVGAINKRDVNNLYKDSEKTGGEKPIDLIRATRPILIVDEPQSVDGGLKGKGKEALEAMNPLCTLRYSATHVHKYHMVYRLDAVDAYERKLVKQIEVAAATVEAGYNKPYVRLIKVQNKGNVISAVVELDVQTRSGVKRKEVTVYDGDDLKQTTGRNLYENYIIGEISVARDNQYMELRFPGGEEFLQPGQSYGDVDKNELARHMIRRTIKEHLDKELRLRERGIKVLSLFFIDEVAKYRKYDEDGNPIKGDYAQIFEEEFKRAVRQPKYRKLFEGENIDLLVERIHNGYFSIDRKRIGGKTVELFKDTTGESKADEDTYNLIMRDKEKLLSLDEPLRFVFSHSALREGWDNPNVFQICTLRDIRTERERRQTIGRGLRLCVDQSGRRVHGFDVNTLTVIANESYEDFARNLQQEIEEDTGIRFGVVEKHQFAAMHVVDEQDNEQPLGAEQSEELWRFFKDKGYLDNKDRVQDTLRVALKNETLELPKEMESYREEITAILKKAAGRLEIKNADERRTVKLRKEVYLSEDFKALWERIKHKTTYRVWFDNDKLIADCVKAVREAPQIRETRLEWRKADIAIGKAGVEGKEKEGADSATMNEQDIELPDLLTVLQDRTQLTRRSLLKIVMESGRLDDFRRNPQAFIDIVADAINKTKQLALVDGIKYQRLGKYYAQELFEQEELSGYLKNMLENTKKSLYEHVICESDVERRFAEDMERHEAVKLYAKLPGWFKVPTPLGSYTPDWAVLVDTEEGEKLYFVVETKGSAYKSDLRNTERAKINCGEKHFNAIAQIHENHAKYIVANKFADVLSHKSPRTTNPKAQMHSDKSS
ncbi:Type III site-specific deoxyribonuclease [Thermovirga lienii DSM 17291]|jgi:type III restriction enzyme|uniref:Type III site-specific deoxyribonuclease n=1 Tax=Thermovirga lienii (strain ATCC BAA-1197 / DSM 17291 / Cas60314) TaxID=580340 RepID=G7V610_THELD|nr:DEAD/DEAH box helicase family protein [Thermovirga lienii]AER66997.1 Type III site-specific deoxyribonuclease [Thermovirga lienii DSM 17291]